MISAEPCAGSLTESISSGESGSKSLSRTMISTSPSSSTVASSSPSVGGTSRLTVMESVAELPTLSVARAVRMLAPELSGTVQPEAQGMPLTSTVSRPEPLSEAETVTLTEASPVQVPSAGEVMFTDGGVLSRLTVMESVAVSPSPFVAVAVRVLAPSLSGTLAHL